MIFQKLKYPQCIKNTKALLVYDLPVFLTLKRNFYVQFVYLIFVLLQLYFFECIKLEFKERKTKVKTITTSNNWEQPSVFLGLLLLSSFFRSQLKFSQELFILLWLFVTVRCKWVYIFMTCAWALRHAINNTSGKKLVYLFLVGILFFPNSWLKKYIF